MKIAELVETLRDSWMFFYQAGGCRDWATYKLHLLDAVELDDSGRMVAARAGDGNAVSRDLARSVIAWFETWRRQQPVGLFAIPARDEVAEYWLWIRFLAELDQAIAEVDEEQATT